MANAIENKAVCDFVRKMHGVCAATLNASLEGEHLDRLCKAYLALADLEVWSTVLSNDPEKALHDTAISEYGLALLSLCEGQYRNAFKGLRLVLELVLQATLVSANLLELREWLAGKRHTSWSKIVDKENGLFSKRYCTAFFEEISDECSQFRTIAETVYTELSECIHGNTARHIPLPPSLEYNASAVGLWLDKCETVQTVLQFALCMRYLQGLRSEMRSSLEMPVLMWLGHVAPIRALFGGPVDK